MPPQLQTRPAILAVTTLILAVTGAWYGAGLKTEREVKQEHLKITEATPAERIAVLTQTKDKLLGQKEGLEKKIAEVRERQARLGEGVGGGGGGGGGG